MKRVFLLISLALVFAVDGYAKPVVKAKSRSKQVAVTAKPTVKKIGSVESAYRKNPYVGAVSMNVATSNILFEANANAKAYPASVTKLMTALLVLEDVKSGRYRLEDLVTVTADVYNSEPSWLGIKAGETISVNDLLLALMVESANDAAIALAIHSAGSFDTFVAKMNARARELGMSNTEYFNPNGLPPNGRRRYPWKRFNYTTASDQAKLALTLVVANPKILTFTSVKTCDLVKTASGYRISVTRRSTSSGVTTTQLAPGEKIVKVFKNHNNIMRTDKLKVLNANGSEAVDGLKTGYIDAGGSSIVLTGQRNGHRVIVVVLGSVTSAIRDESARHLLMDGLGAVDW